MKELSCAYCGKAIKGEPVMWCDTPPVFCSDDCANDDYNHAMAAARSEAMQRKEGE